MNKVIKILFFTFFIFLVAFSLVKALDTTETGYRLDPGETLNLNIHDISRSVTNTGSNTYFVPTKTETGWTSFITNHPSDITVVEGLCAGLTEVELWGVTYPIETTTSLSLQYTGGCAQALDSTIPPEIGCLTNLTYLKLRSCRLQGEIPSSIGNLQNLTYLEITSNRLTGEIPSSIGNLQYLTDMRISSNRLGCWNYAHAEYESPEDCTIYNQAECCNIHCDQTNECSGEIPSTIGNLQNLTELSLWGNQLSGEIPPEIGNMASLDKLTLSMNHLTGEIPSSIGNLTNLTSLSLGNNQLTGGILPEIGNMTNLSGLHLHSNQLTGEIPPGVLDLVYGGGVGTLMVLQIDTNQLSGDILDKICDFNINNVSIHDNQFCNYIPSCIPEGDGGHDIGYQDCG